MNIMTLEEAINKIDGKNCVLFAGSGFSYGAKGNRGILTTASALTKELYESALGNNDPNGNLEDAAEQFIESKGEYSLIEFLKDKFTVFEITDSQEYVGSLPWLRVYTTNYDNVLDIAFKKKKNRLENVYLSRRIRDYKDKKHLCIHLNGTVDNLTTETLDNEFKLTTASYLTDDFIENEWVNLFISDLHTADAIFFIGYSMNFDLDIQRIVRNSVEQNEMKNKCFFIVSENESKYNLRRIEKFGQACSIGLDNFVELVKTRETFDESLYTKTIYCFRKPLKGNVIQDVTAQEALDLYVKGNIKSCHILSSLFQPHNYHYFVKREILDKIVEDIEKGAKQILIESNAGNGKTCCLESLACLLTNKGFDVYYYTRSYESLKSEIETICSSEDVKTVFVIDGFSHARAMLSELELFRTDQIVVVADRTLSCDVSYEWLFKKFGEFSTYDIDRLNEKELHQVVEIFNNYGFFGKKAALRDDVKMDYLRKNCKGTMRDILLDLLNSETIKKRFSEIVSSIKSKSSYYEALILMLVSPIFDFRLDFNQLAFIFNKRNFTSPAFYNNPSICEFIDKNGIEIRIKSSILAECILSEVLDSQIVVDVLIRVFKELEKYRSNEEYKSILRSLVSYQNMKRVLNVNGSDFSTNITRFFEEIGKTRFCLGNHHYWLQYAIARLFEQDYPRALKYFENAYSFAKKKQEANGGNYTYQIDNHFARYLLENEMENGSAEKCMVAFNKAHSLLINPKNKEIVRFYTYRVARNYYRFYIAFYSKMSKTDKRTFLRACEEMYNRTIWYLQSNDSSFSRKDEARSAKEEMALIFKETGYKLNS